MHNINLTPKVGFLLLGFIHDWWTFAAFISLGLTQAVVAVFGGELAVKALPIEVSYLKRKRYKSWFKRLGAALFLLTCFVGFLNDRTQFQAVEDVKVVQSKLDVANNSLSGANGRIDTLTGFLRSLPPDQKISFVLAELKNLKAEVSEVRAYTSSHVAAPDLPQSTASAPTPTGNAISTGVLLQQINREIDDLNFGDHYAAKSIHDDLEDLHSQGEEFRVKMAPQITFYLVNRNQGFVRSDYSRIGLIRIGAHSASRSTPAQIAEDDKAFAPILVEALTLPPTPKDRSEAQKLQAPRFGALIAYLRKLAEEIKSLPQANS
jgi:hypothetical protein